MADGTQQKLSRVRPPRVQITYDVEIGDAIEKKELPFVIGILADLSGDKTNAIPLQERPFVEIDRDNFAAVMAQLSPTLQLQVNDARAEPPKADETGGTAAEEPAKAVFNLTFTKLEDFQPDKLVEKLINDDTNPGISTLWKRRNQLRDMLTKLDGNDPLLGKLTDASRSQKLLEDLGAKVSDRLVEIRALPKPAAGGNGEGPPAGQAGGGSGSTTPVTADGSQEAPVVEHAQEAERPGEQSGGGNP